MRLADFEAEREPGWRELEELLARAHGRAGRLGADDVRRLGTRYRETAADLAHARRAFAAEPVRGRLEALVGAARVVVYAEGEARRSPRAFVTGGYWREVRALGPTLAVSLVVFLAAIGLSALWGATDPEAARGVVPSGFIDATAPPRGNQGLSATEAAAFSGQILTNNIRVTLLCFAAGLLLGVGSLLLLASNGLIIGALLGVSGDVGTLGQVLRLVTAHGVLELSCIVVAAAAGLRLGWTIVAPGPRTRAAALGAMARPTVAVVLGTAPFLVVAGIAEGFVSPAGSGWPTVLAVGFGLGGAYWLGVALLGRGAPGPAARPRQ